MLRATATMTVTAAKAINRLYAGGRRTGGSCRPVVCQIHELNGIDIIRHFFVGLFNDHDDDE